MRKKPISTSEFYRKNELISNVDLTGLGVMLEEPNQDSSPVKS